MVNKIKKAFLYAKQGSFFYHLWVYVFLELKFYKFYNLFSWKDKINSNKIVFSNYFGAGYGDNSKYLAAYVLSNKLPYELVWLIDKRRRNDKDEMPSAIRKVSIYSFAALKELSTAKFWIDNCRKNFFPCKKTGQIYIQTWHGGPAVKKIEKDAFLLPAKYIRMAKKDSNATDYLISNCDYMTSILGKCFWFNGQILNYGIPRNDIFFDAEKVSISKKKIEHFFNLQNGSKTILYAPTFRASESLKPYSIDYKKLKTELSNKFGGEWNILIRLHPNVMKLANELCIPDFVINASAYSDVQELLCASDILITDYSSIMFDFSLQKRPVFLFCTDIDSYQSNDREFYFQPQELPFAFSENNDELIKNISQYDEQNYKNKLNNWKNFIGIHDNGTSCKKIINLILGEGFSL